MTKGLISLNRKTSMINLNFNNILQQPHNEEKLCLDTSSFETVHLLFDVVHHKRTDQLKKKEDDLDATDDREPSEESHGSPDKTEGGGELDLLVPLDLVEGGRVQVDLDQLQGGGGLLFTFRKEH